MGLVDVFKPDDRIEITVNQLIALLDVRAKAIAENNAINGIIKAGADVALIAAALNNFEEKEKESED